MVEGLGGGGGGDGAGRGGTEVFLSSYVGRLTGGLESPQSWDGTKLPNLKNFARSAGLVPFQRRQQEARNIRGLPGSFHP